MRKASLAFALAPLLIAASAGAQRNDAVAKQFAESVSAGTPLTPELVAEVLTDETVAALSQLKGCGVGDIDQVKADLFGVQWKCPKDMPHPKWTAALVTIVEGKISHVALSNVSTQFIRVPI